MRDEYRMHCFKRRCGKVLPVENDILRLVGQQFHVDASDIINDGGKIDILIGMASPQLHRQLSLRGKPNELNLAQT